jgi:hypothetical protein
MEDNHKLQYIKYKTKYLNLRKTQKGGNISLDNVSLDIVIPDINKLYTYVSHLNTVIPEINKLLYVNVLSNYKILLLNLQNSFYKIKYEKYIIINPQQLDNISKTVSTFINIIEKNYQRVQYLMNEKKTFNEQHTKIYNNLYSMLKFLITEINTMISTKTDGTRIPDNIKKECDTVYKTYDESLQKLYNLYKLDEGVITDQNGINLFDTYEKLIQLVSPEKRLLLVEPWN